MTVIRLTHVIFLSTACLLANWTASLADDAIRLHTIPLPPLAGTATKLDLTYEAHVGGFRVGVIDIDAKWNGEKYTMDSRVWTEGLAEVLVQARYHNSSHGIFDQKRVAPIQYSTHYKTRDDQQYVKLDFDFDEPVNVFAKPKYSNRHQVTRLDKRKSVDPMSSILYMIWGSSVDEEAPCGERVPIYDGKRRYDFKLRFIKEMTLSSNDPQGYNGPGLHCKVQYQEVAGFRKRDPKEKPYPWIDLYMARFDNGKLTIPVRMTLKTLYGSVVARATHVKLTRTRP